MVSLATDEKVIKIVRKHWFVLLGFSISIVVLALVPIILASYLLSANNLLGENIVIILKGFISTHGVYAYSLWSLILWIILFIEWTDYYLDAWVITNRRIIDIEQKGFFHRHVTSFRYEQIQDISVDTKGLIATLFKYGTLHIHTAGAGSTSEHDDIIIKYANNPESIRSIVIKEQERALNELHH